MSEEAFVLRLPEALAAQLREQLRNGTLENANVQQDGRKMKLNLGDIGKVEGDILDLPTHVEVHREFEKTERRASHVFKVADVAQIVVVKEQKGSRQKKIGREIEEGTLESIEGLTPPSRNIRKIFKDSPLQPPGKGEMDYGQQKIGMDTVMSLVAGQEKVIAGVFKGEDEKIYKGLYTDAESESEKLAKEREEQERKEEEERERQEKERKEREERERLEKEAAKATTKQAEEENIFFDGSLLQGIDVNKLDLDLGLAAPSEEAAVEVKEEKPSEITSAEEVALPMDMEISDDFFKAAEELEKKEKIKAELDDVEKSIAEAKAALQNSMAKRDKTGIPSLKERFQKSVNQAQEKLNGLEQKKAELRKEGGFE